MTNPTLSPDQIQHYHKQGFLILPGAGGDCIDAFLAQARQDLQAPGEPRELEAVLGYPGAPDSTGQPGGDTVRRLLLATERHPEWYEWATSARIATWLRDLLNAETVYLNPNHHNCLMTKSPRYSSDTRWHQDIRYWHFTRPELVSVWLALGEETAENGGLVVIPGSHRASFAESRFDAQRFFLESDENQPWLEKAVALHLNPGDVLLFDCRLLHRASRNRTRDTKFSLVFTYRAEQNPPLAGTRSARLPEIPVG